MARRAAMAFGLVVLAVSTFYLFAYLYWWEWNHAIIAGVFLLAVEGGLIAVVVLGRLTRLEQRLSRDDGAHEAATRTILRDRAPRPRDPFAWLSRSTEDGRVGVFVPVLLGAGVVLSGAAWVVERLAQIMGGPKLEQDLAGRLERLAPPPRGFLATDDDPLALLRRPGRGRG